MEKLKSILDELNNRYFGGRVRVKEIRLMKKKSNRIYGRFNREGRVIEINPIFLTNENALRFVIYHELCHAKQRFRKRRHKWHTKKFWALMRLYEGYKEEYNRYLLFLKDYWLSIGHLTQAEIDEW